MEEKKRNETRPVRGVEYSKTEQIQIVMPESINGSGRLFGGKLL